MTTAVESPELKSAGGIYNLIWHQLRIIIRADRLYEDSKYNTFCEMTIRSDIPGLPRHIHQARVNLVSSTTRRSLIRELEQRAPDLPWPTMIEQFAVRVLESHRKGEPTLQMAEYDAGEALGYRLAPLLMERQATVFYGQGETGKSFVSLLTGIMVASGRATLGWQVEPGGVLYLDYETSADEIHDRLIKITAGLGIPLPDQFFYRYMTQSLPADVETIQREVIEKNISLVIVDSAAPASLEPETSVGATAYFSALRTLGCTSLTVAHTDAGGKQDRPFGSIFWRNLPRANFRFRAQVDADDSGIVVAIKQTRANNNRRIKDIGLEIRFSDDEVTFRHAELASVEELAETLSLRDRISYALRSGGMTAKDLAEELQVSQQQVRNQLSRAKGKLFVMTGTNGGQPTWGLQHNNDDIRHL